jgi:hypothetical protein
VLQREGRVDVNAGAEAKTVRFNGDYSFMSGSVTEVLMDTHTPSRRGMNAFGEPVGPPRVKRVPTPAKGARGESGMECYGSCHGCNQFAPTVVFRMKSTVFTGEE